MSVLHNLKDIPLNKLVLWEGNVRKTGGGTAIDELAASIAAHGLLNPLTVGGHFRRKHYVIAGGRRLAALNMLAEAGKMPKDAVIRCVMAADADYTELSLAENVARVAMHPADQFEAWRGLIDNGASTDEIAIRFGVPASTVRKRMTLARVSPVIFDAYRDGSIDLEALQAFTVSTDHAAQEAVFGRLPDWQMSAVHIRRSLTEGEIPASDRRVRFVGLDAYEAAGGAVRRDLFDTDGGGYVQDVALLDRLAQQKLDELAVEVKAEGWQWAEGRLSFDWSDRQGFGSAEPDESDEDETHWPDEVKAVAGAVVWLGFGGAVEIERGLVRPDDAEALPDEEGDSGEGRDEPDDEPRPAAIPAYLVTDLTAHKTAALRVELARSPETALALTVHAMASRAFYRGTGGVLKASLTPCYPERSILDAERCPALLAFEAERERMGDLLPGSEADLWAWCLKADTETLLDVLAVSVAQGLDAVVTKTDPNRGGSQQGASLAEALKLDMAQWYKPTADGYFKRVPRAVILSDLEAAKGVPPAPAWSKLKKPELAALAERECSGLSWLPEPLR